MTLAFTKTINNKPTHFMEKIINGLQSDFPLIKHVVKERGGYDYEPKLHTIRTDKSNRWHPGAKIHLVVNNRSPQRYQFAPTISCISTQKIEIIYKDPDGFSLTTPSVYVDDVWMVGQDLKDLVINDGFVSITEFFEYFKTDFTGKIIHWTTLKY